MEERMMGIDYSKQYKKQSTELYNLECKIQKRAKFLIEQHPELELCIELEGFWDIQNTRDFIKYIMLIEEELEKQNKVVQLNMFDNPKN